MQVIFRTDASLEIGAGHVMRCLTLALGLFEKGATVSFLCRAHDGNLIDLIKYWGFFVHVLPVSTNSDLSGETLNGPAHAAWLACDWQSDLEHCRAALPDPVDWIIIDHYAIDYRWEQAMRDKCRYIMCIDDLADRMHDCDVLLDQNLGRTADDYHAFVSTETHLLLGPSYALLRPEFAKFRVSSLTRRQAPKLCHLLVAMGGVDKDNVTGRVLKALANCRLTMLEHITVVLGTHAPWVDIIRELAVEMEVTTTVLSGANNMAELLTSCDLAIGAGGATTWERCSLGVPTIMISLAENQKFICKEISKIGAAILCDVEDLEYELEAVLNLASDPDCLKELSNSAAKITNGDGMQAIQKFITEF